MRELRMRLREYEARALRDVTVEVLNGHLSVPLYKEEERVLKRLRDELYESPYLGRRA